MKQIWMTGTWPENNYTDILVAEVQDNITDEELINLARLAYGETENYYIRENV